MKKMVLLAFSLVVLLNGITLAKAEKSNYVEVIKPFANVYEYLDPKSNIVRQAHKGEFFELIYEGTSWYQIKVKDKVGWLEKRAGEVVDSPKFFFSSIPTSTVIMFAIVLIGSLTFITVVIIRQRSPAEI